VGIALGLAATSDLETWERHCHGNPCIAQRGVDAALCHARG
jgi:hypothetical protein